MLLEFSLPTVMYGIDLFLSVSFQTVVIWFQRLLTTVSPLQTCVSPLTLSLLCPPAFDAAGWRKSTCKIWAKRWQYVELRTREFPAVENSCQRGSELRNMMEHKLHHTVSLLSRTPAASRIFAVSGVFISGRNSRSNVAHDFCRAQP